MTATESIDEIVRRLCTKEAPLAERLAEFSAVVRERETPYADAYDELARRLRSANAFAGAPNVGDVMPPFALPDGQSRVHLLEEMLVRGPAVISFNRGHWCPYCMVELNALKQGLARIAAAGAEVVSIMPDMPEYVAKVAADVDYAFLVLSDANNGYALSLDLVMWLGERIKKLELAMEFTLETSQRNGAWFVPIPATFVVAPGGVIVGRFIDPDFRNRMEIDDIVTALRRASI